MSQMSDPFLESIALGVNNMGQATQNWNVKAQAGLQGQALRQQAASEANRAQMQQTELAAQAQMQQQAQAAQSADYAQLNASRERMAQQEMAQQESQFSRSQAQERELKMMQSKFAIRLQEIEAESRKIRAQIVGQARNSPELKALREKRRGLEAQARSVEMAMNSGMASLSVAQDVKTGRLDEVESRIDAVKRAAETRRDNTNDSFNRGLNDTILGITRQSGYWQEAGRVALADGVTGMPMAEVQVLPHLKIMMQNLSESVFGYSNPDWYRERMTFENKSPTFLAGTVVENTFTKHGDGLGLKDGMKDAAKTAMLKAIGAAGALRPGSEISGGLNPEQTKAAREQIATELQNLMSYGMGSEQIMAFIKNLEGLSENSAELVGRMAGTGAEGAMGQVLEETLTGVGGIADVLQDVAKDPTVMTQGPLVDLTEYDTSAMYRRARAAYALSQDSPEMQKLLMETQKFGMPETEKLELVRLLTEADPRLQQLNPDEILRMIEGLRAQSGQLGAMAGEMTEEEQLALQEYMQQAELGGAQNELDILGQLAGELGG